MNAQEKAQELYDKMYKNCTMTIAGAGSIWKPLVKKQCEIICDEIQNELTTQFGSTAVDYQREDFWQQVKEANRNL